MQRVGAGRCPAPVAAQLEQSIAVQSCQQEALDAGGEYLFNGVERAPLQHLAQREGALRASLHAPTTKGAEGSVAEASGFLYIMGTQQGLTNKQDILVMECLAYTQK